MVRKNKLVHLMHLARPVARI